MSKKPPFKATILAVVSGKQRHVPVAGHVLEETDTHYKIHGQIAGSNKPATEMLIPKNKIVENQSPKPRTSVQRTAEDRDSARSALLESIGNQWTQVPADAHPSDIQHLITQGHIESVVRQEYDRQRGNYSSGFFGGAGAVQRKRKYVRRVQPTE